MPFTFEDEGPNSFLAGFGFCFLSPLLCDSFCSFLFLDKSFSILSWFLTGVSVSIADFLFFFPRRVCFLGACRLLKRPNFFWCRTSLFGCRRNAFLISNRESWSGSLRTSFFGSASLRWSRRIWRFRWVWIVFAYPIGSMFGVGIASGGTSGGGTSGSVPSTWGKSGTGDSGSTSGTGVSGRSS